MKYSFYLFLVCLFFVSCNKSIHFTSDAKDPAHVIDYSLLYEPPRFTPPPSAQSISLNNQSIDFIQLASADVTALHLPASHPMDFTDKSKGEDNPFVRSGDMSMSPSVTMTDVPVSEDKNTENGVIELNLAKQETRGLVVASLEKQQPDYPVSPEWRLDVGVRDSNENFVPESDLTLGGHKSFVPLVSADVSSLRLSVNRPLDIADKQGEAENPFVRSEEVPVSPSVNMEAPSVGHTNTEDEVIQWNLAERKKTEMVVALMEEKQPGYPASPEWHLGVGVEDSNENFVPESDLTLGGHKSFVQLASADTRSLRLSVNRPLDITDKREGAENPFVRSEDVPVSPSVNMEAPSVGHRDTEDETIQWDLAEQGRKELVIALTEGEEPHYPSSPLWVADAGEEDNAPEEVFIPRLLDILFVVDTSVSMHEHLESFKEKFMGFLRYFFNFNWKLAITDADHGEHGFFLFNISTSKGRIMPLERNGSVMDLYYLDRTVEHYNQIFLDSISRHQLHEYQKYGRDGLESVDQCELPPYCQGGNEQPLKSLKAALSKNQDFYRENADLVVVIISNSKERADDYESGAQPEEVIGEFRNLYGEEKRLEVYGIIIPKNDRECLEQNKEGQFWSPEGDFSEKIARLSAMTGGETFSICSDNYQQLARSIFHSFGTDAGE